MPYATLDMLKQRARIAAGDTSQDANLNAKNIQAAREIDLVLKYHGLNVPVSAPTELVNQLSEINADLAVGLFWEEVGPMMQQQANQLIKRARDALQKVVDFDEGRNGGDRLMYKELLQKIIDILKVDSILLEPDKIKNITSASQ